MWRRATGRNQSSKIFCLLNADLLDYDHADQAEKSLEELTKGVPGLLFKVVIKKTSSVL